MYEYADLEIELSDSIWSKAESSRCKLTNNWETKFHVFAASDDVLLFAECRTTADDHNAIWDKLKSVLTELSFESAEGSKRIKIAKNIYAFLEWFNISDVKSVKMQERLSNIEIGFRTSPQTISLEVVQQSEGFLDAVKTILRERVTKGTSPTRTEIEFSMWSGPGCLMIFSIIMVFSLFAAGSIPFTPDRSGAFRFTLASISQFLGPLCVLLLFGALFAGSVFWIVHRVRNPHHEDVYHL